MGTCLFPCDVLYSLFHSPEPRYRKKSGRAHFLDQMEQEIYSLQKSLCGGFFVVFFVGGSGFFLS